jgi:hypothetical protein
MLPNFVHELTLSLMRGIGRIRSHRALLALTLILCGAGFVVRDHNAFSNESRRSRTLATVEPASRPVVQGARPEPLQVVKFTLYDVGIYPREAHAEEGLLWIIIEDYSGGTTGLVVERETGNAPERVGSVQRDGPHWRGKSDIRLGAGRYRVHMADRPANQAVLIVGPRAK